MINTNKPQSCLIAPRDVDGFRRRTDIYIAKVTSASQCPKAPNTQAPDVPPPTAPQDQYVLLTEDEGKSVKRDAASGDEIAGRGYKNKQRILRRGFLNMLGDNSVAGAVGVVLGLPRDGHNFVKQATLPEDNIPPCFL